MPTASRGTLRFGVFELDLRAEELHKHGIRIKLHRQPFQVLVALLERPGEVVTRDELRKRLWSSGTYVNFDHSLGIAINRLREALGDSAVSPRFIETLPRRGYRFIAPVAAEGPPDEFPVPIVKQTPSRRTNAYHWFTRTRSTALLVFSSVVVIGCIVAYSLSPKLQRNSALPTISVALLPFTDISSSKHHGSCCGLLVEQIGKTLSSMPGLRVIARTSTLNSNNDLHQIAREMNTPVALAGNVEVADGRVRITAQLVNGSDGSQIWSETYERPAEDLFAVQNEVAKLIATALRVRLVARRQRLLNANVVNPKAYSLYQRGRSGPSPTLDSIHYFEQAIRTDPTFGLAYVGLASTYGILALKSDVSPREVMPKAKQAVLKALEIDDDVAEVHLQLGIVKATYDWDWIGAEREFRRALELNPKVESGRSIYALYLAYTGRFDEAMDQIPELDPLPIGVAALHASIFYFSRQYQRTIEYCRWFLAFAPGADGVQFWLGRAYSDQSRLAEAIDLLERTRENSKQNGTGFGVLAALYARAGRRGDALRLLAEVMELAKRRHVSPVSVAIIHIGLGDSDRAFEWLDRACYDRDFALASLKVEPIYDSIREDPRFKALLRRVNLE